MSSCTQMTIVVYKVADHEFRSYLKGDAKKTTWAPSKLLAGRKLQSDYSIGPCILWDVDEQKSTILN